MRKDGVHEKVAKQRELLNHKVVLMIVQVSTSKNYFNETKIAKDPFLFSCGALI